MCLCGRIKWLREPDEMASRARFGRSLETSALHPQSEGFDIWQRPKKNHLTFDNDLKNAARQRNTDALIFQQIHDNCAGSKRLS